MSWVALFVAGLLEVVWAFCMKQSAGFTKLVPSIVTILTMALSFGLLAWSMRSLPLGTAYAVWTGIGAVGSFVLGVLLLGEHASPLRLLSIGLILVGLVGLRLA